MPLSLKGWQACLAIRQDQLNRSNLNLSINESITLFGKSTSLQLQATSYTVEVLDHGQDLIRLQLPIDGQYTFKGETTSIQQAILQITTTFQVIEEGDSRVVVPILNGEHANIVLKNTTLADATLASCNRLLSKWTTQSSAAKALALFRFKKNTGVGTGVSFRNFQVTSTFARFAPTHSSILLLMKEDASAGGTNALAIDPHILPTGQEKVLWVTPELLAQTGGQTFINEANAKIGLRPRPMNAQIHDVSNTVQAWSKAILDGVSLPGGLDFISMEMKETGLMLSATPLSLEEYISYKATDVTQLQKNPVQAETERLFSESIQYHMDEQYLEDLLEQERPSLPKEVQELTTPDKAWFEQFGRLQMGAAIADSDAKEIAPFKEIDKEKVDQKINELLASETYKEQLFNLNSLAYCVVHPRISIFKEQADHWKQGYYDYVLSQAFINELLDTNIQNPVAEVHNAIGKLNLLHLGEDKSGEVLETVINKFMIMFALQNWRQIVGDNPAQFVRALKQVIGELETSKLTSHYKTIIDSIGSADDIAAEILLLMYEKNRANVPAELVTKLPPPSFVSSLPAIELDDLSKKSPASFSRNRKGSTTTRIADTRNIDSLPSLNRPDQPKIEMPAPNPEEVKVPYEINRKVAVLKSIASFAVLAVFMANCVSSIEESGTGKEQSTEEKIKSVVTFSSEIIGAYLAVGELSKIIYQGSFTSTPPSLINMGNKMSQYPAGYFAKATMSKMAKGAKMIYKWGGAVLSLLVAALAIWDAVESAKKGNKVALGLDISMAIIALAQFTLLCLAGSTSWSGPVAVGLAIAGLALGLFRFFFANDDNKKKKTGKKLVNALKLDYASV